MLFMGIILDNKAVAYEYVKENKLFYFKMVRIRNKRENVNRLNRTISFISYKLFIFKIV